MIILAPLVFRSTSSTVDVPGWPWNTCSSRMLFLQRMLQTVRVQMPAAKQIPQEESAAAVSRKILPH